MTSTFKPTKARLAAEGYWGASDPVWVYDRRSAAYVPHRPTRQEHRGQLIDDAGQPRASDLVDVPEH